MNKAAKAAPINNQWLTVDKEGLRKQLEDRDKSFVLRELVSNAWDEHVSRVDVTLSVPNDDFSTVTVIDDNPNGWSDLTHAYTMFAESSKKSKAETRGRFNAGEKAVLALCVKASVTTVTGQVLFNEDGTRTSGKARTTVGSEFKGKFRLTMEEYRNVIAQAEMLLPPEGITTTFNGKVIPSRKPVLIFEDTLPSVLSGADGILRRTAGRKTSIELYEVLPGETATIFEMGIGIVALGDDKWHINVMQKVPLSMDRDNVTPGYLKTVRVAVYNAAYKLIATEEEAAAQWVTAATSEPSCSAEAIKHLKDTKFGENAVLHDNKDVGSNKEAASKGATVVPRAALTSGQRRNMLAAGAIQTASEAGYSTDFDEDTEKKIPRNKWTPAMERYAVFVEGFSGLLVGRAVKVRYINDKEVECIGHTQWNTATDKETVDFVVNMAYHEVTKKAKNYELLIHELAHNVVRSNDHLCAEFYEEVTTLGAKLAILALEKPELFNTPSNFSQRLELALPARAGAASRLDR